jgi:putative DNA primase/helicase
VQEDFTDLGNARRFARIYGEKVRYVTTQNLWLVWEDGCWSTDTTHEVQRLARAMVRGFYDQAGAMEEGSARRQLGDWARACESRARLSAILDLARSEEPIAVSHEGFDADPWLLNCRNGTVDLRTGTRRPHRREDLITKLCPVVHDPDATCPQWEQFVRRIMDGNKAMARFLRRLCGYLLTGTAPTAFVAGVRVHERPTHQAFHSATPRRATPLRTPVLTPDCRDWPSPCPSTQHVGPRGGCGCPPW